jgi:hypothetical protein
MKCCGRISRHQLERAGRAAPLTKKVKGADSRHRSGMLRIGARKRIQQNPWTDGVW